ncbi:hypothetical protein ABFU82_18615 [Nocardioides sp. WV_118_6]|nr:hypothetical protein [Pimelobacter simplex]
MQMTTSPVRRRHRRSRRARAQVVLGAALVVLAFAGPAVLAVVR